ncbi:hypothetical protein EYC84_002042 [Monilinia fructicola]|uniref:BTB domain-containing protein n=1 Tax=Monilinia fructicola TaxID=38448 RepID=A0A5M9JRJ3_MONFR|nr:hypothetical protein EYC84_002042 [Monilinia fructicola]
MEETDSSQSSEIIEIASDGDVIFVVGPEMVRFRVRSQSLRAVSKPFFAMLGPDWKEGHDMLDKDGPVELSLPEDNPAALKMIFALVHRRKGMVPRTLTPRFVLEVAITVDKYDLVDFMKFASGEWLRPGQRCADDLMILAAAAYLFQNAQGFKEITKALLLEHEDSYLSLLSKEIESVMAWRVFCE